MRYTHMLAMLITSLPYTRARCFLASVLLDAFDIDAFVWVYVDGHGLAVHWADFALKERVQQHQGVLHARFITGNLGFLKRASGNARAKPSALHGRAKH